MITELTRTETGWQQTRINRRSLVKRWGEYEEGEQENKKEEEKPNIFYFLFITHTHTKKATHPNGFESIYTTSLLQ